MVKEKTIKHVYDVSNTIGNFIVNNLTDMDITGAVAVNIAPVSESNDNLVIIDIIIKCGFDEFFMIVALNNFYVFKLSNNNVRFVYPKDYSKKCLDVIKLLDIVLLNSTMPVSYKHNVLH